MNWLKHEQIPSGSALGEPTPTFGLPIWTGERGRVLVNADFGAGDTIQYARYLRQAQERADIVLRCDEELHTLLEPLGIELTPKDKYLPPIEFDFVCHLAAVPGVFKAEISSKPYLEVNRPKLSKPTMYQIIALQEFTKIGVCWAGNPFNSRDAKRSIGVAHLIRLLINPEFKFFSLQKQYEPPPIMFDARGLMGDWNETAALVEQMELIITVDTGIAHLAGAMGKRTWLLLPREYDPRWNEPWYDTMKIYWQQIDWPHLLDRVAEELSRL
jgi:hypothetical protein